MHLYYLGKGRIHIQDNLDMPASGTNKLWKITSVIKIYAN